jgi:radical SAM superfamily enzyme YgiQ (UPF0313 family)
MGMNEILLIDVDSKIPNIVLMKLSAHYKKLGKRVTLLQLHYDYYSIPKKRLINSENFEKVFVSIIFDNNKNSLLFSNIGNVSVGGTGYDLTIKLPDDIESITDYDYSLYNETDISYGFITRGCIRNCSFCFVPKKEGYIKQVSTIDNIVKFKLTKFLDNNILAFDGHKNILSELVDKKIRCQFNQGLDIRLLDNDNAKLLSQMNYFQEYIFAFDNIN